MARQICVFRQGGACHSLDDSRVTHRPGGLPSVTLAFLLSSRNASQYHYAKWEERSRGTAALMHRAAAQLDFARGRPLDVWVHVADAGWPELPLPINAAPRGVTLETVASSRAAAASLFPDYSLAGWEAIGYDHREHSLRSFVETLLLAGQRPTAAPLRPQAVFVGNELMHPVRTQLRSLAQQWPAWLDVRHVPPYDADGARQYSAEHVDFPRLAEWAILLDVPGGGWSGRLKFLPLMQRPLLVLDRAAWGWADGAALEPYAHYRPVRAAIAGSHVGQTYALDTQDLFTQLAWCRDNPRAAAAMAQRALRRTLETLIDEAVDSQAVHVLRSAVAQKRLLQEARDISHTHARDKTDL